MSLFHNYILFPFVDFLSKYVFLSHSPSLYTFHATTVIFMLCGDHTHRRSPALYFLFRDRIQAPKNPQYLTYEDRTPEVACKSWISSSSTCISRRATAEQPLLNYALILYKLTFTIWCNRHRGSYTSGHSSARFINFIWNVHECKILFIIWAFKMGFYRFQNGLFFSLKTYCWHGRCQRRHAFAPKFYYTCGHTIFMTWCYPLNNSDVIW